MGEPRDFPQSIFVVGHGSLDLLRGESKALRGSHSFFERDLLDPARTIQLPEPETSGADARVSLFEKGSNAPIQTPSSINFTRPWQASDHFDTVLDLFGDGSLYVVDAPGHLPGHINLLARVIPETDNEWKWLYLAGDSCHDRRIVRGERDIGEWYDAHGQICCIHADKEKAKETIQRIRNAEKKGVEVILAHDVEWETEERNRNRFFGATL